MTNCAICNIEIVSEDSIVISGKYAMHLYCHKIYRRKLNDTFNKM